MDKALGHIHAAYVDAKLACDRSYVATETGEAIKHLAEISLLFLADECEIVVLKSKVPGKEYFSFVRRGNGHVVARPANARLFVRDPRRIARFWREWERGRIGKGDFARFSYTVALAPCLAMELFDRQNKKGPTTYFECLIGHLFAKELGVNPQKQASIRVQGKSVRLTMDFLFAGQSGRQIHLPVKMSTRERVVQAWAHQRILDGAHGENTFRGIMVLFSETKLDSRTREVVEICVPDQWLVYQTLLSKMERIYYFDVPCRYRTLTESFPEVIQIKPFGEFFKERASLFGRRGPRRQT
ncbi:MAG: hypothetical protein ACLQVA_16885 [Candidatus Brocadiia bacterium]